MPRHTDRERARNKTAKRLDAERNRAANERRSRGGGSGGGSNSGESPFKRGLRGMFGLGVEGSSRALERAENVFERATEKLKRRR